MNERCIINNNKCLGTYTKEKCCYYDDMYVKIYGLFHCLLIHHVLLLKLKPNLYFTNYISVEYHYDSCNVTINESIITIIGKFKLVLFEAVFTREINSSV